MPATLRRITFDPALMYSTTGVALPASGSVTLRRHYGFLSGGQWIMPGRHDAAYANGAFTTPQYLPVPDSGAAAYDAIIDGAKYTISLAAGAPVELSTLLLAGQVADVSAVDQLLSLYALLAAFDGVTITVDPVTGIISAAGVGDVTQAELDAEATSRQTADTALQLDIDSETTARIAADVGLAADLDAEEAARIAHAARADNPHAVTAAQVGALTPAAAAALYQTIAAMTAYAQLAVAQTFTKTQTIQGDAATQATAIFKVIDSSGSTIATVRRAVSGNEGRLTVDAGNVSNVGGLRLENLPSGSFEFRVFAGGGYLIMGKDGNGVLDDSTGHVRRWRVNTDSYSTAGKPSHSFEDEGRAAIDTLQVFPGDTANTSKVLAVRRKTSTSDAVAGRWNVYFSDTTHATRTSAGSFTLIKAATEVTPLAYDTQDSATQTGILVLHNGTQKRVEIGAADSGGAGYRMLRITN